MPPQSYAKLIILGSSSGVPQADRATSGYVLKVGSGLTLVDCGGGVTSSFLRRGLDPLALDRIIVSHTHPDHVCEIALVLQMVYLAGRTKEITIYVPEEFVEPLQKYLPAVYLFKEKLTFGLNIIGYSEGDIFERPFKVSAIGNSHLRGNQEVIREFSYPNRMQSFSLSFDVEGSRLFYSGDIGSFDCIRGLLDGNEIALIESTHFDLKELLDLAPHVHVGKYVLTHLGDSRQVAMISKTASVAGVDNIVTAMDGMEVPLS